MVDPLIFLTSLTLILIAGIISISLSKRLKLPLPLVLFIFGFALGNISYYGKPLIQLSVDFLSALSLIALVIVLFDSTSKIKFHDYDKSTKDSLVFFVVALILNLVIISYAAKSFFNMEWFAAVILSFLISCIEYVVIFPRHHVPHNKLTQFLKDESNISCAFMLLVPFLLISFADLLSMKTGFSLFSKLITLSINIFAGIGAGIIIALVLFNLLNKSFLEKLSSYVFAVGLLLAFILAQQIDGNGFVAVATIGFIFGNVFLKHKGSVVKQENSLYSILEVFIFILVGIIVGFPLSLTFLELSLGLFLIYLIIRFVVSRFINDYDPAEKLEIAFFVPKGLSTVAVAFALLNYAFPGVVLIVQLLVAFFVYSLIFDTVLDKFGFYKHR